MPYCDFGSLPASLFKLIFSPFILNSYYKRNPFKQHIKADIQLVGQNVGYRKDTHKPTLKYLNTAYKCAFACPFFNIGPRLFDFIHHLLLVHKINHNASFMISSSGFFKLE